ncbi:30S ribosome-binding factor RbfA [Mycoplasma sp. 394]
MNEINLKRKESQVHQLIVDILEHNISNVNIINPTVMDVRLSSDLSDLKVYVNFESNTKKGLIALNNAAGYVRKILAKSLDWRKVPTVRFFIDDVSEKGARIDEILRNIEKEKQ